MTNVEKSRHNQWSLYRGDAPRGDQENMCVSSYAFVLSDEDHGALPNRVHM